jgi:hypothetical protein
VPQSKQQVVQVVYEDAGREVTQNFATLYSNISLSSGLLAAILAALGAGELFNDSPTATNTGGIPDLSPISLMILCLAYPLLVRALVRSMLGYNNLLRYNKIRKAAWNYLSESEPWSEFYAAHQIYETRWKAPEGVGKSIRSNLKYGFFWLFFVFTLATGWAFYSTTGGWQPRIVAAAILVVGIGWESINLARSAKVYFSLPTDDDWRDARRDATSDLISPSEPPTQKVQAPVFEQATGVFIGGIRRTNT